MDHQEGGCCGCTCGAGTGEQDTSRREFIYLAAGGLGVVGAASTVWPLVDSMNPAADTLALSSIEVDISSITEGQAITVMWRGAPVFIRRRTAEEIAKAAENDGKIADMRDPALDKDRLQKPEWLIVKGVCTHLGCIPQGQKVTEMRGQWGGYFCSCHGSQYDTSGRIMAGPAPRNLEVPPYAFVTDTLIRIG